MTRIDAIASRGAPDRPSIIVPAGAGARAAVLTYGELDRAASEFAAALRARGAVPGDRLVLANANTPEFFVALFGAARARLVAVPLDTGLAPAELRAVLDRVRPHAAVADPVAAGVLAPLGVPLCSVADASRDAPRTAPGVLAPPGVPRSSAADTATQAPRREPDEPPASTEPALLLYTSGTTGTPRGAVHTHAGILRKVEDIRAWFALGEADRAMCMLPTHFGHGLVCACLTILHAGGTLVLCRRFDAALLPRTFDLADAHGVATFSTVPTIVRLMLRDPAIRPPAAGTLRYVTCASAPLHPEEVDAFEARFGVPLLNCYGMTEAGTWSAMSPIGPARDRRSVGIAVGCRVRAVAVDGDLRRPLPDGEIGELEVSGPSVMVGYDGDPAATAGALRGGWLATGDLGHVDGEGRVFLSGRAKDLIIRAGANIYPAEVERALLCHAAVAEAYVVGLDHAVLGEQVGACIVRRPGAEISSADLVFDLIRHCRTLLAPYKCPEVIRFVDTVPKTSRGKVSRAALRDVFARTAPG